MPFFIEIISSSGYLPGRETMIQLVAVKQEISLFICMDGIAEFFRTNRFFGHTQVMIEFFIEIKDSVFITEREDITAFQSKRHKLFFVFQVFLYLFFTCVFPFV